MFDLGDCDVLLLASNEWLHVLVAPQDLVVPEFLELPMEVSVQDQQCRFIHLWVIKGTCALRSVEVGSTQDVDEGVNIVHICNLADTLICHSVID